MSDKNNGEKIRKFRKLCRAKHKDVYELLILSHIRPVKCTSNNSCRFIRKAKGIF